MPCGQTRPRSRRLRLTHDFAWSVVRPQRACMKYTSAKFWGFQILQHHFSTFCLEKWAIFGTYPLVRTYYLLSLYPLAPPLCTQYENFRLGQRTQSDPRYLIGTVPLGRITVTVGWKGQFGLSSTRPRVRGGALRGPSSATSGKERGRGRARCGGTRRRTQGSAGKRPSSPR